MSMTLRRLVLDVPLVLALAALSPVPALAQSARTRYESALERDQQVRQLI